MPLLLPQTVIMLQFCNFVASFTAEPQSLTLSDMLAVETVSKVESCPAATARWLEPSLPHSLISVYPLVLPQPMVAFYIVGHLCPLIWEWIMLLKPTPVVTYSISKAQSPPLTFTNPATFFILLTWLLHKVEIYWNQRFPFRSRWKFRFTKSYALSSEVWPWFLLFFCPQSCTGPRYKTQY